MGLDVGEVRIGVAVSDETGLIARALATIPRTGTKRDLETLIALAEENQAEHIVVGHPLNLNGSQGIQADRVNEFVERLQATTLMPITLWDERFSSLSAERVLIEGGIQREKRKRVIDKLAAVIILQNFLDHRNSAASTKTKSPEDHDQD